MTELPRPEVLHAFEQWTYHKYYDPDFGWTDKPYGTCTFINHVFLLFGFNRVIGFPDAYDQRRPESEVSRLYKKGLCSGHDFAVRDKDGLVGDLWAYGYLHEPTYGRLGRGNYPTREELDKFESIQCDHGWLADVKEDWDEFINDYNLLEGYDGINIYA